MDSCPSETLRCYTMTINDANGDDTGRPFMSRSQLYSISPMDTYEICKLYNCGKCAGKNISSYSGQDCNNYLTIINT